MAITPFQFPNTPHTRKHAPSGYKDYGDYKPWLRDEFQFRCVYCLWRETWSRERHAVFSVDHVVAQVDDPTLICLYDNLVYACLRCNSAKQNIRLLDPCIAGMATHVRIGLDGRAVGLAQEGHFLIELLHLNAESEITERQRILRILERHERLPTDEGLLKDYREAFGFPADLPDLRAKRPPGGNSLTLNLKDCFFAKKQRGELPEVY